MVQTTRLYQLLSYVMVEARGMESSKALFSPNTNIYPVSSTPIKIGVI